jgi:hypothetical protein
VLRRLPPVLMASITGGVSNSRMPSMIGVRDFADLRPENRQICVHFLRI